MNELADVTKTRSIQCMAVEEPTIGQLSVMVDLIRSGTIFVDLAIFGTHTHTSSARRNI